MKNDGFKKCNFSWFNHFKIPNYIAIITYYSIQKLKNDYILLC